MSILSCTERVSRWDEEETWTVFFCRRTVFFERSIYTEPRIYRWAHFLHNPTLQTRTPQESSFQQKSAAGLSRRSHCSNSTNCITYGLWKRVSFDPSRNHGSLLVIPWDRIGLHTATPSSCVWLLINPTQVAQTRPFISVTTRLSSCQLQRLRRRHRVELRRHLLAHNCYHLQSTLFLC